jgi:hypothetical protein
MDSSGATIDPFFNQELYNHDSNPAVNEHAMSFARAKNNGVNLVLDAVFPEDCSYAD